MAVRNGSEFVEGLRRAPREVWISGRRIDDVTADPVFARPVQSIAALYDLQVSPEHRDAMTHRDAESDEPYGTSFLMPRTHADLVKRRLAMKVWAEATFGMVGRSPDYLNTTLMTFAENADFFGQRGARFADNIRNYYKFCRDRDLFLTHALVNPQTDRSKGSHQQAEAFAHLGVVEETKDGLIVRGAKMLATHGPTADEILVYPQPGIMEGEETHVLAFGIPCADQRASLHLPRAVRRRHAVGLGSSARRTLRGAGRGLRVRRRADPVGARVPLRRREDGQRAVLAGEPAQPHRPPDRRARPRQVPVPDRRRHRADPDREVRRPPACPGAARRVARLSATDRRRDPSGGAERRADRPRRDPPGLRAAAGAALSSAAVLRAHGAGDAGAGGRRTL